MRLIFLLSSALLFFLTLTLSGTDNELSDSEEIHHIVFLKDKIFYMSKSGREFGFLSIQNGMILTQYQLEESQSIISIDKKHNKVILRKDRNKALILRLNSLDMQEISVEIGFKHQKIIDVIQNEKRVYVMTEKDVRGYDIKEEKMGQAAKNMLTSGRKKEWFRKMFLYEQDDSRMLKLIVSKDQQICVRRIVTDKKVEQKCLFNMSSEIVQISEVGRSILIQSKFLNYFIKENDEVYSFQASISQKDDYYATTSKDFKTFDFQSQIFAQGMAVYGSDTQNQFWIKRNQPNSLNILHNGKIVNVIEVSQNPIRVWVGHQENDLFNLLIQANHNELRMFEIRLLNSSIVLKWSSEDKLQPIEPEL